MEAQGRHLQQPGIGTDGVAFAEQQQVSEDAIVAAHAASIEATREAFAVNDRAAKAAAPAAVTAMAIAAALIGRRMAGLPSEVYNIQE